MTLTSYPYTKSPVCVDRMTLEIQQDANILTALDHIDLYGSSLTVWFKAALSAPEQTELNNLVAAHSGLALPSANAPLTSTLSVTWTDVKAFSTARTIPVQWVLTNNVYQIYCFDGPFNLHCTIATDGTDATNQTDFETNFKAAGNKKIAPKGNSGNPILEPGIFTGAPGAKAISICTPNLGDRTTWYQKSVQVVGETLTTSDNLTFSSVNPWWIDILNPKLTYTYKQVPKRDGTFGKATDWLYSVSVNGVVTTTGFTVNFTAGTITFAASQAGNTVTATYWTNNGVTQPSEWLLAPAVGKTYTIETVEIQYSTNMPATMDTIRFEIWAGSSLATYGSFPGSLFDAGYGQFRADYRSVWDIINVTNNTGSTTVPAHGPMTQPIFIAPFLYTQAIQLNAAQGTLLRLCLLNDIPIPTVELATATFYIQIM